MATHAAAFVAYLVLTVALTWPLAVYLGDLVPHDLGDTLLSTAILWWNAQTLPFTARWWDGFFFFPAQATLTLSDHRVGLGLIATPLMWAGASPLAAHNVAFLATYVLSAMAAYALSFALTRSAVAAFVGGLVFGFNPFRAEHLPHLELLASYWLPIVLLSLHRWADSRRATWLVLLATSLTLQAITCGYYFFFSGVLIGLWLLWFMPRSASAREYLSLAVALVAPLVVIAPVLLVYRDAHTAMALARSIEEIETFSADVLGLITPPEPLLLWDTPESWLRPEGAILTGVTAVAVVLAAVVMGRSAVRRSDAGRRVATFRKVLIGASIVMSAVALVPALYGPVAFELGGLRISTSAAYKPLSLATVFFVLWVLTSPRMRDAWRRRSPLAFYVLATLAMWAFALGPTARFLGQRVFYKAPYSWLMLMPGFRDEFRAPARFAMLAALTLSAAAALALYKLVAAKPARLRLAAGAAVSVLILLESWMAPFPVVAAPKSLDIPAAVPPDVAVLELPMGTFEDALAMYHVTQHQRPTVNGLSGYEPPHSTVLRAALNDKAVEALSAVAAKSDIAIFLARGAETAEWLPLLESRAGAQRLSATSTHDVLLLRRADRNPMTGTRVTAALVVRGLTSTLYPEKLGLMLDRDRRTGWSTETAQLGGEAFTADLGEVAELDRVNLALGPHLTAFPRAVAIEVSTDGAEWVEAWRGSGAVPAITAALHEPRHAPLSFDLGGRRARYVRVRQLGQSENGWVVAEFQAFGRSLATTP